LVVNHSWRENFVMLAIAYPTFIADREVAKGLSHRVVNQATIAENLGEALELAHQKTGTDKSIVFDGSYGSINLSPSLGEYLLKASSRVAQKVDEELLPKWLKQRGIDPEAEKYI